MTNQQGAPEALRCAEWLEHIAAGHDVVNIAHLAATSADQLRRLHAENERLAALVEAQQPADHVQNPAETEHVAGDVSKNGAEANVMGLIDAYAEARHVGGCHTYNAKTAEARAKVAAALRTQQPAPAGATPGMAVQALAGEIVDALLADRDEGYDLEAGLFGAAFSKLVRRWAAAEWSAPTPQPAPATQQAGGEPPGIQALMCVISSLRDTAHFSDEEGELTNDLRTLRDWAYEQTVVAPQPSPTAQAAESVPAPIDMVLHCPACGMQHVDAPEPVIEQEQCSMPEFDPWCNPPHRSHLCHGCGHIWRPADVPTNGVKAVKTTGKADSPIAARAPAESVVRDAERLDWLALAGPTSICVVVDRRHDGEVEVSTDDVTGYGKTLREALDAVRKQGANHD